MPQRDEVTSTISSHIENPSLHDLTEPLSPASQVSSTRTVPPNTPSTEYSKSPSQSNHGFVDLNIVHSVDLRAINYENPVDENLICPICRCAFINPISTKCQHTFCSECLNDALSHSEICPIDRSTLCKEYDLMPAPRIIQNQLDNLKVLCPYCQVLVSRSMILNHVSKYCPESFVKCPGINTEKRCSQKVKRELSNQGCLHYSTTCPDCEDLLLKIDLPYHREFLCKSRKYNCDKCGMELLRIQRVKHEKECCEVIVSCKWKDYGCDHQCSRRELESHYKNCNFRFAGNVAEILMKDIDSLRSTIRSLNETNQLQERRIKFLESSYKQFDRPLEYPDFSGQNLSISPGAVSTEPLNSGHEYLLSLLEHQESKLSQLSAGMTELEAKQTTMLFNETIPIKNELVEIRSLQQTASMHIRWLMAFRIRENNRRFGGTVIPNGEGSDSARPSSDSPPHTHRPSDSVSRDVTTKL